MVHTIVEYVERALPKSAIPELFAVAHDATVDLVDLAEAAILHDRREDLAANATGAVRDDRTVLQMVILTAVDLANKVTRCFHVGHDRVFESADLRFKSVTGVKEDHLVATLRD